MYSFLYQYSFVRSPPAGARAMRLDGATLHTNFYERSTTRKREITLSCSSARIDGARRFNKRNIILLATMQIIAHTYAKRARAHVISSK